MLQTPSYMTKDKIPLLFMPSESTNCLYIPFHMDKAYKTDLQAFINDINNRTYKHEFTAKLLKVIKTIKSEYQFKELFPKLAKLKEKYRDPLAINLHNIVQAFGPWHEQASKN